MKREVSVVIPTRNDAAGLPEAVRSSLAQTGAHVSEVLICAGPSTDGTADVAAELAAQFATVHVLQNLQGGISAALNVGLRAASTDIFVRVDSRCRLPPGYISHALETMSSTDAANVGAVQVPIGNSPMQSAIARAMRHAVGSGAAAYRHGGKRREVATAFLGVYKVQALRSVGGWDENFARNEDAEVNHRLRVAGHRIILDPRLRVEYEPRQTLGELWRQYFDYGWWRRRMIARHRSWQLRQMAAPIIVLGLIVGTILAVAVSPWFLAIHGSYVIALGVVGLTLDQQPTPGDRIRVPLALATMHVSWGLGFLASAIRGTGPGAKRPSEE